MQAGKLGTKIGAGGHPGVQAPSKLGQLVKQLSGGRPGAAARPRTGSRRGAVVVRADYYSLLGVDRNADKKTIKQAYRQAARKYHPVSGAALIHDVSFIQPCIIGSLR